jgi:hypothetical protein
MEDISKKYSLVLPTRGLENGYLKLIFKSYEKYLDLNSLHKIIIINPKKSQLFENLKDFVPEILISFCLFVDDETFLEISETISPWYKQQIIKLLVYRHVKTETYLVLDDDIFLIDHLCYDDLKLNDKWKYSSEKYSDLDKKTFSALSWWNGSSNLLIFDLEDKLKDSSFSDHLINVTPQILITNVVENLIFYLINLYGEFWIDNFVKSGATEFSCYWLYLNFTNQADKYTDECDNLWTNDSKTNLLDYHSLQESKTIIENGFNHSLLHFMVIQSYLKFPSQIIETIQKESYKREDVYNNFEIIKESLLTNKKNLNLSFSNENIFYKDLFIVTSIINSPNTVYNPQERLEQTIQTVDSIRSKFSNVFIILSELSVLTEEQKSKLKVNLIFDFSNIAAESNLISGDKSKGEITLVVQTVYNFIKLGINCERLWKISGRYWLNDNFNILNWKDSINVKINDQTTHKDIYTVLYQTDFKNLHYLLKVFIYMLELGFDNEYLEQSLFSNLNPEYYNSILELGCSGTYSVTGKFIEL